MHFYVQGACAPPLPPSPWYSIGPMFYPTLLEQFEKTLNKVFNFFPCLSKIVFGRGVTPTPSPCHPNPWFTPMGSPSHWGQFDETLWDKSNNANNIIEFLRFSELLLGMDGCSQMGTCMYSGNQWPHHPKTIFLLFWVAIMNIYQGHC